MKRPTTIFLLAITALLYPVTAFADAVEFKGTTTGVFGADDTALLHLTFTGVPSTNPFSGTTTDSGYFNDIKFGSFTLARPATGSDTYAGNFSLTVNFEVPANVTGTNVFTATLTGTIKKNGANDNALDIVFSNTPQTLHFGPSGVGSFDLTIHSIENLGGGSPPTAGPWSEDLTGDITNMKLIPAVPEPASIILFGTLVLGIGIWRKARA